MHVETGESRERILRRLSRIEGQVRGVSRMIDEERDCREVVQQLAAVRSAVHQTGLEVLRLYAAQCLSGPDGDSDSDQLVDYLVGTLGKWS